MRLFVLMAILVFTSCSSTGQTKVNLPFVGKKRFEDAAYSTTYLVTIKSDGSTLVEAGGPGINNKGWIVYKGKYKPIMKNKEEGIKIENGFLYLLNSRGEVRIDCVYQEVDCLCKFRIGDELLSK